MDIQKKYQNLKKIILDFKKVAVAFSGGVDSTFLIKVCQDLLGDNALAITICAPIHSSREIEEAKAFMQSMGVSHKIIPLNILDLDAFVKNPKDRCYFCKKEIFSHIKEIAHQYNIPYILDGSNLDDLSDYRPGLKALNELDILSPLKEAHLTKKEIRILSKSLNLPTWNKPAFACLASRFPYGEPILEKDLKKVEKGENYLMDLGFRQFRVRFHNNLARIEVAPTQINKFFDLSLMNEISRYFKAIGFSYVTLDLEGYRMGSLNENI
ncbi:ATP-dependent sacrificial sulfur transferase LarE [Anaerophilus nitritogenes]|uniref:ATP-dependent sacrificial sulfur transferase LarE n=1 Tax=Anaerophilus nitritogenes TaxID=2498136 RepID=UPI00101C18B1|nr:ATP-dependent sacrificial sulfur transferase LarE [Anaerophilus nitritogenes]